MTGRKKDRDPDQGHVRMTLEDRHPVMLLYGIPFFIYVIPARMVNKQQKPRFAGGSISRSLDQLFGFQAKIPYNSSGLNSASYLGESAETRKGG
jgi:hypothetical protein